jgi:hypothetical protein
MLKDGFKINYIAAVSHCHSVHKKVAKNMVMVKNLVRPSTYLAAEPHVLVFLTLW